MNQYYEYKELVLLDNFPYLVERTKCSSFPNGQQVWKYQLKDGNGNLYSEYGDTWVEQNRIKKIHDSSKYSWEGLKTVLKDTVNREDFS